MIEIDHPELIPNLDVWSRENTHRRVLDQNNKRYDDAVSALGDGDMDDFRYRMPRWFIIETDLHGEFVAFIKSGGDEIEYELVAKVAT